MAGRQNKVGLDYFELDCHMDDKIKLIEAEFGLKGFAIIVKLYQSIYSGYGYYCEWTPDISLLWAMQLGISPSGGGKGFGIATGKVSLSDPKGRFGTAVDTSLSDYPDNLINKVIAASIRRDIFSKELFDRYRILTSSGIQKRYLNATSKREKVELKKEYLLLSAPEFNKNVIINSIYDGRNAINDIGNAQSRVEKSRVEKSRVEKSSTDSTAPPATNKPAYDSNEIDELYKKYGKDFVDERINRIDNYPSIKNRMATLKKWCEEDFNNPASKSKGSKYSNSFNDFPQREYSEQELEEIAMKKRGG